MDALGLWKGTKGEESKENWKMKAKGFLSFQMGKLDKNQKTKD